MTGRVFFIDIALHQKYLWKKDQSESGKFILFTAQLLKLLYIHVAQEGILRQNTFNIVYFSSLTLK
jgi:hypothetical protein